MVELRATWTIPEIAGVLDWDARSALAWLESKGVPIHKRGGGRGIRFVFLSDLVAAVPAFGATLELVTSGQRETAFGDA